MHVDDRPRQLVLDEMGVDDDMVYTIVSEIRDQTRAMMETIRQIVRAEAETWSIQHRKTDAGNQGS